VTLTLLETIQGIVREELGRVRTAELATVQSQHPHESGSDKDNYACTVELRTSGTVLKQVPVATPRVGTVSIPAVGELVLVQYLNGDVNAPVITGRFYNDADRPPENADGQAIMHLPLGAADDEAVHAELHSGDKRELVLKLGANLALTMRDDDPAVELEIGGDKLLTIAQDGALKLECGGAIEIKGDGITLDAGSGTFKAKGNTVELN